MLDGTVHQTGDMASLLDTIDAVACDDNQEVVDIQADSGPSALSLKLAQMIVLPTTNAQLDAQTPDDLVAAFTYMKGVEKRTETELERLKAGNHGLRSANARMQTCQGRSAVHGL